VGTPSKSWLVGGAIVFLASFMPWSAQALDGGAYSRSSSGSFAIALDPAGAWPIVTATGWSGVARIAGVVTPNWLAVLAILGAVYLCQARVRGLVRGSLFNPAALLLYGSIHCAYVGAVAMGSRSGSIGIGFILTLVGCFVIARAMWRERQAASQEESPRLRAARERLRQKATGGPWVATGEAGEPSPGSDRPA
jgi:hypothetical protein